MVCKRIAAYFITVSVISLFAGKSIGEDSKPQGGKVSLQGFINDCACSIASGDDEQRVDLSLLAKALRSSHDRTEIFSIFFTSCTPVPASAYDDDINKRFRVTFSNHIFESQAGAVNPLTSLYILDANQKMTAPGELVMIKNNQLKNRMQVLYYIQVENKERKTINRQITSSVRFSVDYY